MDKNKDLLQRREIIRAGGGSERIKKQHEEGKLTARERIDLLVDDGTFFEVDDHIRHRSTYFGLDQKYFPADGVVTGIGKVNGREVAIFSQDFTVQGGSVGEMHAKKIVKIQDLAMKMGIPLIGINDSGGARIQEGVDALYGYGEIFYRNTLASGVIPQITVIAGPCAGGAVYSPAITDFVIMVDKTSKMFITGPEVIKAVTGEDVTQENLGGAEVHNSKSGVAHFIAKDDKDAMEIVKKILSYLPSNNMEMPSVTSPVYLPMDEALNSIIPESSNKPYDMIEIINRIVDPGTFFEVHQKFARSMITGFARINGRVVGIVANQPKVLAGVLDIDSSDKAARFIRFLDAFNIPVLTFADTPGFLPGISQEYGGIIRHGAKLLFAYSEASVPKITVITRRDYGGAYIAMGSKHLGADLVMAWPSAEIAVMGADGAANIIFRNEIKNSSDPEKTRSEKIKEYAETFSNPYVAASRGYVDTVILPSETREKIIRALEILSSKVEGKPAKKHGNIPL
ncbi:acyl-CoA carboxylase subunit beta [Athalassotoga saccharophila]|uniref:acyl-CoA carboxylase subunit beta n=1 Tax=Athalassotoga saccharophila TaxID=1441386 RepID=UPI0018D6BD69|nr:acyl-CoA carboxylase subunit beta [Athalassotoga saccharophila]BBJ28216.1 propionyl-CoA carboxylase beta chain [Athalassotoga saccharophila]